MLNCVQQSVSANSLCAPESLVPDIINQNSTPQLISVPPETQLSLIPGVFLSIVMLCS